MDYSKKVVDINNINYEEIRNKYSEEYLYSIYLGYYPDLKKMYKSPFKEEKNPSFNFYIKEGKLKFKDYSSTLTGTVVDLVMKLYGLSFMEAVYKIYGDVTGSSVTYNPGLIPKNVITESKLIEVITKEYTQEDFDYWEQYYFDLKILEKYNIKPCKEVWLTKTNYNELWYNYNPLNPCYRYLFGGKYKCYKPYELVNYNKWRSNCGNYNNVQGIEYLKKNDILVITKSYKDVICFNEFIDIPSIAFHGEGHYIDEKIIKWIKKEYKQIYFFYDNDKSGIDQADKLSKLYDIPYVYIPNFFQDKDLSDYIKSYGIKEGQKLINNLIK